MKKRNLDKVVILSMLVACISVPVYAADIEYHGDANGHGNPSVNLVPDKSDIHGVDVGLEGIVDGYWSDTTAALVIPEDKSYNITGDVKIINTVQGDRIDNNDALFADNSSKINIHGDDVCLTAIGGIEKGNGSTAITADWFSKVDIVAKNKVQLIGNIDIRLAAVNVSLNSKDSFWYGDEKNLGGNLNITLSDGAEWIYNSNSTISQITLNNGGIINLQDENIKERYYNTIIENGDNEYKLSDYRSDSAHNKVTINKLKGTGGIFKADIDWETNQGFKEETSKSDYIYINKVDESAKESVQILDFDVAKANLDKMDIDDKLYFATVKNGETKFTTKYGDNWTNSEATNIYDYNYGVGSDAGDWYIELADKSSTSNANVKTAVGAMYAGYALGTELDSFNKRLGEARYLENNQGLWVRYRHAKTGWDNTYKTDSDMIQIGIDNNLVGKDGKHYRGVAIDYTNADTSLTGAIGEGENERYAVSFYDTWLGEKGHYRDVVIRGGRINSDYDVKGLFSDGYRNIGSDYHQNFGSISAEWGRTHNMENGWYFEPQTQVQLARVDGADYLTDSGIKVNQKGATSLIGFLGFRLGREYQHAESDRYNNYYLRAGLMHEFIGDKEITLTGSDGSIHKEYGGTDTWFNVGIGADISIAKNSYFWADVEKTFGSDWDNTWQINGGLRWKW